MRISKRSSSFYYLILILVGLHTFIIAGSAFAAGGGDGDHDPMMEAAWQGFNLLIVLGVLVYFGRGPVGEFFATRRSDIQKDLSEAADLLSQAERRNADLQRRLGDLSSELEDISESTTRRAEEESERILAEARATAERIRNDAHTAVDQELRRAKSELRDEAATIALELAAEKLSNNVSDADRERLMDEFITRVEPATTAGQGANS